MIEHEFRLGNRLPWKALITALALAVTTWTANAVGERLTAPRESAALRVLPPSAERLAQRFGVRRDLAAVIYEQARRAGLQPAMVFGVIATESAFDPTAIGRHGERGLMQIKPSTALAYDERVTPESLHDPELNVRLGLTHLKREVEYFGDPVLGLMSYHMGRARLERRMADGSPPRDRYVERVLSRCGPACA